MSINCTSPMQHILDKLNDRLRELLKNDSDMNNGTLLLSQEPGKGSAGFIPSGKVAVLFEELMPPAVRTKEELDPVQQTLALGEDLDLWGRDASGDDRR